MVIDMYFADYGVYNTTLHKYLIVHVCVLHYLQIMAYLIGSQQTKMSLCVCGHNIHFTTPVLKLTPLK